MFIENLLFLIPFLCGFFFVIGGLVMIKFPPGHINRIYGYRSPRSMKSKERWDFAQKYSSRQMLIFGSALIGVSVIGSAIDVEESKAGLLGVGVSIFFMGITILKTEIALRKQFGSK